MGGDLAIRNFGTVRAAKLLALLSLSRSGRMPRTQLAEQLWPEDLYDSTRLRLRQEIHRLKRILGSASDLIGADANDVWLDRSEFRTDLDVLEGVARGRFDAAFDYCLADTFLPGWDDPWAIGERARATKLQLQAAVSIGNQKLESGDPAGALALAKRLIVLNPLSEEIRMVAVNAHSKLGSVASAVAEYQDYRREVRERLGVEAEDLSGTIISEVTTAAAVVPTVSDWSETIPLPIDPIFGREELVSQVLARLEQPAVRLVTLVGPGGVGKTRLAVEIARRLAEKGDVRVAFASLADVSDPQQWPRAVLAQLKEDPPTEADPLKYLTAVLQRQVTFLVLDNMETVLPEAGPELRALTADSRHVRLIGTSVSPTRAADEVLIPVGPLDATTAGRDLLAAALQAVRPQAASMPGVEEELMLISKRLDGYPLALRLVSARFRLLAPRAILDQLESALAGSARGDLPERHRSLESALASSMSAQTEAQRRALERIAAYPGGLSMELAAIEFQDEPYLDLIEALLDSALLTLDDQAGHVRVRMLAPIHQYVQARLEREERSRLEERASRTILAFLDGFDLVPWGPLVPSWLLALDSESDNMDFAWRWACENDPSLAYRHAAKFIRYEAARGRAIGRLEQFIKLSEHWQSEPPELVAELELAFAFLAFMAHKESYARDPLERASALAEELNNPALGARVALWMAQYYFRVDFPKAQAVAQDALAKGEAAKDRYVIARAHALLGTIDNYTAQYKKAMEHLAVSYRMLLELDGGSEAASAGIHLAGHLCHVGRDDEADVVMDRCRAILTETRVPAGWAFLNEMVGRIALDRGRMEEAEASFRESLRIWQAVGSPYQEADQNHSLCLCLWAQGRHVEARPYLIASGELWFQDNNMGGLCCALTMLARMLHHTGDSEAAKEVLAFSVDLEKEHGLVLVEQALTARAMIIEELGGTGSHDLPLTIEAGRSLFNKIV